jgi:hypothetical protein
MSKCPTPQQQQNSVEKLHVLLVHYCLAEDWGKVRGGLSLLFMQLNFNPRIMDFRKFYDSLKDDEFFPSLSILFLKIGGPFLSFEKFKAFFENLCLRGLLDFDIEEHAGQVEVRFPTLSKTQIEELVSRIKIVSSISLIQVFCHLSGILTGGPITWLDLYEWNQSFKSFFQGQEKDKKALRNLVEKAFENNGVTVTKLPQLSFTFPPNWGNDRKYVQFVLKLVSTIGFEEIPYISGSSEEESVPDSTVLNVFEKLKRFFSSASSFRVPEISNLKFLSQTSQEQKKRIFALLLQFCFAIKDDIATPHPNFHEHIDHFVVAFMRIIGASLEGVSVQGTIKSGPTWVHENGKKRIVCSSVATGKDCRNAKTCTFLHSETEYGIITTHCGKVFIVCRINSKFDKTAPKSSVLGYNFKSGMVSIESTHPVAHGGSAYPRAHAVAGGGFVEPRALAVAGGGFVEPRALAVAGRGFVEPIALAVAGGGSADQETRVVACGDSDEKNRYRDQMLSLMRKELMAFDNPPLVDPLAVVRFSLGIPPPPESGSHSDNIARLIKSQTGDPDALLRTASTYVIAMKDKNAMN